MANNLHISYDLNNPGQNYRGFEPVATSQAAGRAGAGLSAESSQSMAGL